MGSDPAWSRGSTAAPTLAAALRELRQDWAQTRAEPGTPGFAAAARRRRFFEFAAPLLVTGLLGVGAECYEPEIRTTSIALMFRSADDEGLAILVSPDETDATVDAAPGFGLTYQSDRDLLLALSHQPATTGGGRSSYPTTDGVGSPAGCRMS